MSFAGELRLVHVPYQTERVAERRQFIIEAEQAWARAVFLRRGLPDAINHYPIFRVDKQWPLCRDIVDAVQRLGERSLLAPFAYWQGDYELAWRLVDELLPDGPAIEPGDCIFVNAIELQRVAVALALDAGDLASASAWLKAHDRWLAWAGAVLGLADGQLAWAAYCRTAGDDNQARAHAERAITCATEPRQPLALVAAHRLLGELDTDAGFFDDAARHLDASLRLADACDAPFDRALTLLALAALLATTGDHTQATVLLDEARAICTPLGAQPTLARANALATRLTPSPSSTEFPAGLSAREVEVLSLLTRGMSNRAIASQLFVSVRTVERHIRNLYTKINAHNRADATAFAFRHGLT
jgi:ATP/maltotriose-dependent transcriptional regulator MalT